MTIQDYFLSFDLTDNDAEQLECRFESVSYKPGDIIMHRGDISDSFFCIESGELAVVLELEDGSEETLDVLSAGQFFGEIGLLQNSNRTATVKALTHSKVYCTDKRNFFSLVEKIPAFSLFVNQQRLQKQLRRIPWFSRLSDDVINRLIPLQKKKQVTAGTILAHQGNEANRIFIIVNGVARQIKRNNDGSEVTMGEKLPGDHYFDNAFLEGRQSNTELIMEQDGEVLEVERKELLQLANHYPSIAAELPVKRSLVKTVLPFFYDKSAYSIIPAIAMNRPRMILWTMISITMLLMLQAVVPSIWPEQFPLYNTLKVDTDPENMLSEDEPARVLHNQLKKEMKLYDMMVVGVVNKTHPDGIYNPESLKYIHELSHFATRLHWEENGKPKGVISVDIMSPSNVDNISQNGPGAISFSWLMPKPPLTREASLAVRDKIKRLPLMAETLASKDDQAIALYLPLTEKDVSYRVYQSLLKKIEEFQGDEQFYITGLPIAEDAFGVEMFIQMAISAPLAMIVIFLLMYYFFRNLTLIYAPMVVAMVSVIITMSLLIISGQTVHIMSSMIPIFIMPIAVLDSVHILSEFFDFYPRIKSRRLTMEHVMRELFAPMFYTSFTTVIGFASLALVPIPPVQVFGIFVAIGVALAWLLSISFIPAYIFLVKKEKLVELSMQDKNSRQNCTAWVASLLQWVRKTSLQGASKIVATSAALAIGFIFGITQIIVNDNPIRWFKDSHPISVSDQVLNEHFAGTYMAYLAFKGMDGESQQLLKEWKAKIHALQSKYQNKNEVIKKLAIDDGDKNLSYGALLDNLEIRAEAAFDSDGLTDSDEELIDEALSWLDQQRDNYQIFKQPEMLNYLADLQAHLLTTGIVGKSVTLTDFVKTVNRELHSAEESYYRVPDTPSSVAQALLTYQNSHRPQDLWRFVTTDYRQGIVWLIQNSGDNVDMKKVVDATESYIKNNPPPFAVTNEWFGLNYINVVWQEKMVNGMMYSILGSYFTVMLIMLFLLRSFWWSFLAMLPLTVTMLVIYGVLGLAGKAYDMPVAVLSALAIGLAVDFAIHFNVRMRHLYEQTGDWQQALLIFFNEPAQALLRNLLVVAIGFTPLLFAPLVPYNTVGYLIAAILFVSGIVTLLLIPSIFKLGAKWLFVSPANKSKETPCEQEIILVTLSQVSNGNSKS